MNISFNRSKGHNFTRFCGTLPQLLRAFFGKCAWSACFYVFLNTNGIFVLAYDWEAAAVLSRPKKQPAFPSQKLLRFQSHCFTFSQKYRWRMKSAFFHSLSFVLRLLMGSIVIMDLKMVQVLLNVRRTELGLSPAVNQMWTSLQWGFDRNLFVSKLVNTKTMFNMLCSSKTAPITDSHAPLLHLSYLTSPHSLELSKPAG